MKNLSTLLFILLALTCSALFGAGALLQQKSRENVQNIRFHPAALQELKNTYKHIAKIDAFFPLGQTNDAGVLLNPYIPLDARSPHSPEAIWWNNFSTEDQQNIKEHWLTHPEKLSFPKDDLLKKLLDYDHWDLSSSGPYSEQLKESPIDTYPHPDLNGLQYLARIRLAQGRMDGDILSALKEVRHLSRLCQGHDFLPNFGVVLLSIERAAYEAAVAQNLLQAEEWDPISESDTSLALKLPYVAVGVFFSHDDGEAIKEIQSLPIRRFDECAVLQEAGMSLSLSKHYLPSRWPFEADLLTMVPHFEEAWRDSGCELPIVRMYWEDPTIYSNPPMLTEERIRMGTPYLRTYSVSVLMTIGPFLPDANQSSLF